MTRDELIARALVFAGAIEDYPFGEDLLTWSDVRDLQAIRLFLCLRYYRQLRSETQN